MGRRPGDDSEPSTGQKGEEEMAGDCTRRIATNGAIGLSIGSAFGAAYGAAEVFRLRVGFCGERVGLGC